MPPKKKPRTPTPPRRVQAPQQRKESSASPFDAAKRQRAILYGVAGAGLVGLIAAVLIVLVGGGGGVASSKHVAALLQQAGCSFRTVPTRIPAGEGTHESNLNKPIAQMDWTTSPPAGGQHYPAYAVWGFYTDAVNPRMVVHNEEHGGVIYWWGPQVPQSTIAKLRALYDQEPTGTFGTPYAKLGSKVAITAWTGDTSRYQHNNYWGDGHIGICPSYTPAVEKAFVAFRKLYRGHGPEGVPLSADQPGMGPSTG